MRLFCSKIVGRTNGYRIGNNDISFTLQGDDGKNYRLVLHRSILDRDPNLDSSSALAFQRVKLENVEPITVNGILEVRVTEVGQLTLLDDRDN